MRCVFHLFFFFFSACPEIHIFFSRKQEHVDVYGARSECLPDQERLILESLPGTHGRGGGTFFDGHRNATFLKFSKACTLKYANANKHTCIALSALPLTLYAISLYIAWMCSKNHSSELSVQIDRRINQTDDKTDDIITSMD